MIKSKLSIAKKQVQKGLTLIELMIAGAILSIVAAIAIDIYEDYTVRTRIAQVVEMAAPLQSIVNRNYSNRVIGLNKGTKAAISDIVSDDAMSSLKVTFEGAIHIDTPLTPEGEKIVVVASYLGKNGRPDGFGDLFGLSLGWKCYVKAADADAIDWMLYPAECRRYYPY